MYNLAEPYQGLPSKFFVISSQTGHPLEDFRFSEIPNSEILQKTPIKSVIQLLCVPNYFIRANLAILSLMILRKLKPIFQITFSIGFKH